MKTAPLKNDVINDPVPPLTPDRDTLPKWFLHTARQRPTEVAMRKKRFGIWQEYTWADSLRHVSQFCLGLVSLGLTRESKVCIVGDNDPEYYWAELAAQSAGGITIGIFSDATPRELEYLASNSESLFVIAHDQEQVDKMLDIKASVPQVKKIIYWDEKGLHSYGDDWLMGWNEVEALGAAALQKNANAYAELVAKGKGEDVAILSYTSGTTSLPKGAMVTHANIYYGSQHPNTVMPVYPGDDYVSFSPLAWITEQSLGIGNHVVNAMVINFPEQADTIQHDIRDIAPVMLLFSSRLWESLVRRVQAQIADADIVNRNLYKLFLPVGYKMAQFEEEGKTPPLQWKFLNLLAELAIFAPIRDKLGLTRLRYAYTSGSAISPDILRFFRAVNVDLHQLYGSTECQGHTIHYPHDIRVGTVGKPLPTVQIKVDENGEIAVKSRSVFKGYYKAEEKTKEVLVDGWFHTGDAGYFDERGHLIYLDRLTDMIELANGEKFSPQYIEGSLKFSPYIHDVMAIGSLDMPYVTVLLTIDFDNTARWAEKRGINFTTMADLSQRDEVADLLLREVERVNSVLPPNGRVRRFVVMPRSLDADESELTRTRKIRRRYMEQKYGDILNALYGTGKSLTLTSEVRYRDGRVGQTESEVMVRTVGDASDLPKVDLASVLGAKA